MISEKTIQMILDLTKRDKKTLSQKALKVCEEAGELAKVVLPFDDAPTTTHRFVSKERVLEEVADVFLTSISVAYDLGFTEEEFEQMVVRKLVKWSELQSRADKTYNQPIPYEIHITVENANKDHFISACKRLDVKPIILDLQSKDGKIEFEDVMTSSVYFGNNRGAYEEMKRITNSLIEDGFSVVREKIETVPWHPAAPRDNKWSVETSMPPNCYFETHINVISSDAKYATLESMCDMFDAHLSKNVFKRIDDNTYTIMVTYRSYEGTYQDFQSKVDKIITTLQDKGFDHEKIVTEFSIYDTRLSHDTNWLNL